VDWFFDARDTGSMRSLRDEFGAYLRRHADAEVDVAGAEMAFSELVTNAVRHAPGPAWVHLDWSAVRPVVEVHDLGPGFELRTSLPEDPFVVGGRGLYMVNHLTDELSVAAKRAGGSKVTTVLSVTRPLEESYDPEPTPTASLPAPEEAADDGTFGKESFLRALVVEMARAVESSEGPGVRRRSSPRWARTSAVGWRRSTAGPAASWAPSATARSPTSTSG